MATITTRAGKGSPLTNTEMDTNLTNLNSDKLELTVETTASSATPTPSAGTNHYTVTALAANATFGAPAGTPTDGQKLVVRVKDNGTSRTLAWNAIYRAVGITLPTATTISKTLYVGFIYNSADTKWDGIATVEEA